MEEVKFGLPTRFNDKFLSKFVTNRSIDLETQNVTHKVEIRLSSETPKSQTPLNFSKLKKPPILDNKLDSAKSNGGLVDYKESVAARSNQYSSLDNPIYLNQGKQKAGSSIKERILKEETKLKEIMESGSKLTFYSPKAESNTKKQKMNLLNNSMKQTKRANNLSKQATNNNSQTNNTTNTALTEKKQKAMINLKKKIPMGKNNTASASPVVENGIKSKKFGVRAETTEEKLQQNEIALKKPSILSSPVSPKGASKPELKTNFEKKPTNEQLTETITSNQTSLSYLNSQFMNVNFSDANIKSINDEKTNAKFSTLQVDSRKTTSEMNDRENGFIRNKYKNLLESFLKSKKIGMN